MTIAPWSFPNSYDDVRGRTPVDPALFKQSRTLIAIHEGQSMEGNFAAAATYVPTSGEVYELRLSDGQIYKSDGGPIFNSDGGLPGGPYPDRISVLPYRYDLLVNGGNFARALIVPVMRGGTSSVDNCPVGFVWPIKQRAMDCLNALGLSANMCFQVCGQQDVQNQDNQTNNTNLRVWAAQGWRAMGMTGTIVIGRGVYWAGVSDTAPYSASAPGIKAAQYGATLTQPGPSASGPDDDTYSGVSYRADGVHWNDVGRYYSTQAWLPSYPRL